MLKESSIIMLQKIFWQIYQLPIEFLTVIKNDELLIYLGMGLLYVIKNSVKLFCVFFILTWQGICHTARFLKQFLFWSPLFRLWN